ncbi:LamB/YcsF family protein [Hoeflea poritis]|uniref:LamB/YcsF family protein n=1 Tax=Hoeflea poritis TaxID=2993659 RepID=A0ABT4VQ90_9HYPH|nr:LamB/YcsF family protein [Hoeflea poritis]MDA4846188.1 LamB/YcsF family protein [Hoeflea poritis]
MSVDINCDMGESFGIYRVGDDEAIMPHITQANIACGFHSSDPNHMRAAIELARRHGVKVGAHFSLPDLAGFGRREMTIDREEMANIIIYQIGALKGFLDVAGIPLSHLKPHGALYGMAANREHIAHGVADAAEHFRVPLLGLAGTLHEEIYTARGLEFQAEFFSDLDYDDEGKLIITREHAAVDPEEAARRTVRAVTDGLVRSVGGKDLPVRVQTVCVHSDTPNAAAVARSVHTALEPYLAA